MYVRACSVRAACVCSAHAVHTRLRVQPHLEGAQVAAQCQLVLGGARGLGRRREQRAHLLAALLHVELARRHLAAGRGRRQRLQQRARLRLELAAARRGRRRLGLDAGLEALLDGLGSRRRDGDRRRLGSRRHVALSDRRRVTGGGVEAGPEEHRRAPRRSARRAGPLPEGARGLASLGGAG